MAFEVDSRGPQVNNKQKKDRLGCYHDSKTSRAMAQARDVNEGDTVSWIRGERAWVLVVAWAGDAKRREKENGHSLTVAGLQREKRVKHPEPGQVKSGKREDGRERRGAGVRVSAQPSNDRGSRVLGRPAAGKTAP